MVQLWKDITAGIGIIYRSLCGGVLVGLTLLILAIAGVWLYGVIFAPQQFTLTLVSLSLMQFESGTDGTFSLLVPGDMLKALLYVSSATSIIWYTVELKRSQRLHY